MRTLHAIVAGMRLLAAGFEPRQQAAEELHKLEQQYGIDPFLVIAVVEHESGWRGDVVGKLGELGLGQVMPTNFKVCREEPDSQSCENLKRALQRWDFNLKWVVASMALQRVYCWQHVGSKLFVHWLQEYQGYDRVCGHRLRRGRYVALPLPKATREVVALRAKLLGSK